METKIFQTLKDEVERPLIVKKNYVKKISLQVLNLISFVFISPGYNFIIQSRQFILQKPTKWISNEKRSNNNIQQRMQHTSKGREN